MKDNKFIYEIAKGIFLFYFDFFGNVRVHCRRPEYFGLGAI